MIPPRVSVIVPMFNAQATIGACLDSLRRQDMGDWEAVVVDDGSTDAGAALVRAASAADPRIRLITQPNRGLSAARNAGIVASRGRWLNFLDSDDWLLPDALRTLTNLGEQSPHGLACAATRWHADDGSDLAYDFSPGASPITHAHLRAANRFQVHAAVVARETLADDRFDESLPALEDLDLWLRLTSNGASWCTSEAVVAAYRLRPASMSRDPQRMLDAADTVLGHWTDSDPITSATSRARIAIEQVIAWVQMGRIAGARKQVCNARWLPPSVTLDPAVVADALRWRVPFLVCLPPTAWRDNHRAGALVVSSQRVLDALISWGCLEPSMTPSVIAHLARLCAEPAEVAHHIAGRIEGVGEIALHGLGRNAATLVPALLQNGHSLVGHDDAAKPGTTVEVGGHRIAMVPAERWKQAAVHIICPAHAPALEGSVRESVAPATLIIKWSDATADICRADHARLLRLWPRTRFEHSTELAA